MSIEEVKLKLFLARQNRDRYRRIAADPKMSHRAALAAQQLARSYQAAVALGEKALQYEQEKQRPLRRR
jgi:hypothetical protein